MNRAVFFILKAMLMDSVDFWLIRVKLKFHSNEPKSRNQQYELTKPSLMNRKFWYNWKELIVKPINLLCYFE